ncbi:RNA-binding S4 domain-containing protein [Desulfogranum japonicum]|uniref:RNA-binding S4 domain-containing protein n=1 Tax=Desulfogranum japonicum TaxID=231447 RepID=UPI0003FA38C4|nr:RNA-binding S4 domain-containing protein [Desulfogranum japonicum]
MTEQHKVTLFTEYIELFKLLKRENISASGGEAKYLVSEGYVSVNGTPETRKRRKIRPGDVVECFDVQLVVVKNADE